MAKRTWHFLLTPESSLTSLLTSLPPACPTLVWNALDCQTQPFLSAEQQPTPPAGQESLPLYTDTLLLPATCKTTFLPSPTERRRTAGEGCSPGFATAERPQRLEPENILEEREGRFTCRFAAAEEGLLI